MKRINKCIGLVAVLVLLAGGAMAGATYTNYPAGAGVGGGLPAASAGQAYLLTGTLDTGVRTQAVGDVINMIMIPSNTLVLGVGYSIEIPRPSSEGSCSIWIGDTETTNGWISSTSVASTAPLAAWSTNLLLTTGSTWSNAQTYSLGKFYGTYEPITLTVNSNMVQRFRMTVKALAIPVRQ